MKLVTEVWHGRNITFEDSEDEKVKTINALSVLVKVFEEENKAYDQALSEEIESKNRILGNSIMFMERLHESAKFIEKTIELYGNNNYTDFADEMFFLITEYKEEKND